MASTSGGAVRITLVFLTLSLSGCAGGTGIGSSTSLLTGSLPQTNDIQAAPAAKSDEVSTGSVASATTRGLPKSVLQARGHMAKGETAKALVILETNFSKNPGERDVARELGYVALQSGKLEKAKRAFTASLDPAKPDWRTLSALGAVHAAAGDQKTAQAQFKKALALQPGDGATLNNLAMSYALDGKLDKAEATLRSAAKDLSNEQIKENLALVLALAGKYDAAEKAVAGILPTAQVAANMTYLKSLTQKGG